MYIPKHFNETDMKKIRELMAAYPLATVIASVPELDAEDQDEGLSPKSIASRHPKIEACHVPMVWQNDGSEYGCLLGHVAKMNPIHQMGVRDAEWLVIFQDGGHYISPNWYPTKAETHKEVPTWNYRSVQVYGKVSIVEDEATLKEIVSAATTQFEASQPMPWSIQDAPEAYISAMCRAIRGIKVSITEIQAQFKLSQNKPERNQQGVIDGLTEEKTGAAAHMADLIKAN